MGLARSTYYDAPTRAADDTALVEAMAAICDAFEAYGWRRVQAALRQQGWRVNHKKVRRLMRAHDLQPRVRRRYVTTTDSDHESPIFPNLARDIVPNGPNQLSRRGSDLRRGDGRLCLRRDHPRCVVATRGRLRARPVDRRPPDHRGSARGDRATSAGAGTDPPHGPWQSR